MSQVRMQEKRQSRVLWPLMGFLLAVALLAIAAAIHESVFNVLPAQIRNLLQNLPMIRRDLNIGVGDVIIIVFLFIIMASVIFAIVAVAAPKPKATVTDSTMMKARESMLRETAAKERLARKIAQENRRVLREESKRRGSDDNE